jgi:hypothetical protein
LGRSADPHVAALWCKRRTPSTTGPSMRPQQSPSPHHRRRPPPTYDEERHQEGESQMACLAPPNTATPPRTPDPQPAKCPLFLATSPSRRPNAATPTMANRRNTPQDHHPRPLPRSPLCIPPRRSHKIPSTGRRSPPIQRTSMRARGELSPPTTSWAFPAHARRR